MPDYVHVSEGAPDKIPLHAAFIGNVVQGNSQLNNTIKIKISYLKTAREYFEEGITGYSGYDSAKNRHYDICDIRMPESGKWFLEMDKIKDWINGKVPKLWCYDCMIDKIKRSNNPGHNQTRLSNSDLGIAWVYCQGSGGEKRTARDLCQSLIRQLCQSAKARGPGASARVNILIKEFIQEGKGRKTGHYLEFLHRLVKSCRKCTIVIDALDGCGASDSEGNTRNLLIENLIEMPTNCKLLVLSQRLPYLEKAFSNWPSIKIRPNEHEMRKYIARELDKGSLPKESPPAMDNSRTGNYGKDCLRIKAQIGTIRRLKQAGHIEKYLEDLREDSEGVYVSKINRIKARGDKRGLRALQWIYGAERSLSQNELVHAIRSSTSKIESLDPIKEDDISDWCEGLVDYLPKTEGFDFFHPSVADYLNSVKSSDMDFDEIYTDDMIARGCIRYLVESAKSSHPPKDEDEPFPYARNHWYRHFKNKESALARLDDWRPLVAEEASGSDLKYKNWTRYGDKTLNRPLEVACRFRISWLLDILVKGCVKDLLVNLESEMLVVARYWPNKFAELLGLCLRKNVPPTTQLVEAIAATGLEHETSNPAWKGDECLQGIFEKYPAFQITEQMLIRASNSSKAEKMLQILCDQLQCQIYRRATYEAMFRIPNGETAALHLPHWTGDVDLQRNNSLEETISPLVSNPEILCTAAKNPYFDPWSLPWLADKLSILVNDDVIYAIAERSWSIAIQIYRAQKYNVVLCATKFLRCVVTNPAESWIVKGLARPLQSIQEIAKFDIDPEFIHVLGMIYKDTKRKHLESDLHSCIKQTKQRLTITQNGGRCIARHFEPELVLDCLRSSAPATDVALSILDELYRLADKEYEFRQHCCDMTDSSDINEQHGSREERNFRRVTKYHAGLQPPAERRLSMDQLEDMIKPVFSDLLSGLDKDTVDQEIHPNETSLLRVALRVLGYPTTCSSTQDNKLHKDSADAFSNIIIQELKQRLSGEESTFVFYIIDREMKGLCRVLPANCNQPVNSESALTGIMARLCLRYLLVRNPDRKSVLKDLYEHIVRYYHYLPKSMKDMKDVHIPEDLYLVAARNGDEGWEDALTGILNCNEGWIPKVEHFLAAIGNGNVSATCSIFELLRARADKHKEEVLHPSILGAALENKSEECYRIFKHILDLYDHPDLSRKPDIPDLRNRIFRGKQGETQSRLRRILISWEANWKAETAGSEHQARLDEAHEFDMSELRDDILM
ncbi:hypothetical protein TWF281_000208 [Arthrobotrys megalospora]